MPQPISLGGLAINKFLIINLNCKNHTKIKRGTRSIEILIYGLQPFKYTHLAYILKYLIIIKLLPTQITLLFEYIAWVRSKKFSDKAM
jgi:hypothetical protein